MRPIASPFLACLLACFAGACATFSAPAPPVVQPPPRLAWIVAADGRAIGQATFTGAPRGVLIRLEFSARALPPGWHGLHLHDRGNCSDFAAGFQAAGGHLGMGRRVAHGLLNPTGPEAGDLPNVFAPPSGPFGAEIFSPYVTMTAPDDRNRRAFLLDPDGAALIIHAAPDDQVVQPTGASGARIACAAITPTP